MRRAFISLLGGAAGRGRSRRVRSRRQCRPSGSWARSVGSSTEVRGPPARSCSVLRELGWVRGPARLPSSIAGARARSRATLTEVAAEFALSVKVDVIVATGCRHWWWRPSGRRRSSLSSFPGGGRTRSAPGLVASLARPGGNATGVFRYSAPILLASVSNSCARLSPLRSPFTELVDHGQCRRYRRHAGGARGSGDGRALHGPTTPPRWKFHRASRDIAPAIEALSEGSHGCTTMWAAIRSSTPTGLEHSVSHGG